MQAKRNVIAGVSLSHPNRILYPEQGLTKQDLASYYEAIANRMLPHLVDRPLTLVRCPEGRQKECFYQKHLTDRIPDALLKIPIRENKQKEIYLAVRDLSGLISLVQLGVLEIHPWGSRRDLLERPDRLIFDLDPGPGVLPEQLAEIAQLLHLLLDELGLESFPKTTGGKGYHVVIPLVRRSGWADVKAFARRVSEQMVRMRPDLVVSAMDKSKRRQKIYVDYLRNARGATAVAPYSTRARHGAPVSVPLGWHELSSGLSSNQFNTENLHVRLSELREDPWEEFFYVRQSIAKQMKKRIGL